jgi:multidrug efflux pump
MPIGIAIIGGLMFSLVLTLYVIPALYTYISSKAKEQPKPEEKKEPVRELANADV